jgi:hypothetical protein
MNLKVPGVGAAKGLGAHGSPPVLGPQKRPSVLMPNVNPGRLGSGAGPGPLAPGPAFRSPPGRMDRNMSVYIPNVKQEAAARLEAQLKGVYYFRSRLELFF